MVGDESDGEDPDEGMTTETICAIATPPGAGGVGIVRVSGSLVPVLAVSLVGQLPKPRLATRALFRRPDLTPIDDGLVLYFPAPTSFTGEAVLELQGHGSPVVQDQLLRTLIEQGARLARPGEFSERAFLNGKIDLIQAEAVADLINSATEAAARAALLTLHGAFSDALNGIHDRLVALRTRLEAGLDFPDEDIEAAEDTVLTEALSAVATEIGVLLTRTREGRLLREGATLVLAGLPNAGKSTLLNALVGTEAAIVSPVPGTTRDLVREQINLDGIPVRLIDTAGIRQSTDMIEQEGVRRAQTAMEMADYVCWLVDDSDSTPSTPPPQSMVVYTKIDRTGRSPGRTVDGCAICAQTGAGLGALRALLKERLRGGSTLSADTFTARRRHVVALQEMASCLQRALGHQRERALELVAEELRRAHHLLGEMTGVFTTEDLLGEIFSHFCIGK